MIMVRKKIKHIYNCVTQICFIYIQIYRVTRLLYVKIGYYFSRFWRTWFSTWYLYL